MTRPAAEPLAATKTSRISTLTASTNAVPVATSSRWFVPDLIKAAGCVLIVLHHLAFYGPMSDVVAGVWPRVIEWLFANARLAVQAFLVVSGFLTAQALSPLPRLTRAQVSERIIQRYMRLAMPLLAALSLTVLVSELVRPGFDHDSLSDTPDWFQAWAHVFFLQHALDEEALSAGVWYVAIDLQLYVLSILIAWGLSWLHQGVRALQAVWLALTLASMVWWNRRPDLDDWALYFIAAYGMGLLAGLGRLQASGPAGRTAVMLLGMGALAWLVEPRERMTLACAVALSLALAPQGWMRGPQGLLRAPIDALARISYSVFVVHFGISLAVNALFSFWRPDHAMVQALGMVLALGLSLLAGGLLYRWVERRRPNGSRWAWMTAAFMASNALAMWLSA